MGEFVNVRDIIPEAVEQDERDANVVAVGVKWAVNDCEGDGVPVRKALVDRVTLELAVEETVERCDGDADEDPDKDNTVV